jgi:hypothetical protein
MTELIWQQLINEGILTPYKQGTKAYLNPVAPAQWNDDMPLTYDQAQLVFSAATSSSNYWPKLKQAIRRGQDNIEPVGGTKNLYRSFRPLAIVSAQLDLQLMGEAEVDKSWQALSEYLLTGQRRNRKFTQVKWPIKLGEYNNIDDGLIAYWTVTESQLSETGYFPQSDMSDVTGEGEAALFDTADFNPQEHDYVDQIRDEGVINLTRSLDDAPLEVLMLMDVQASVHATTGIVPRKKLTLVPEHYVQALKNIQSDYFAAPLLTPKQNFSIPLAGKITWRWQQRDADGQTQQKLSGRLVSKAQFFINANNDAMEIEEQWQWLIGKNILALIPQEAGMVAAEYALLNAIDLSTHDEDWLLIWKKLEPVVQASSEQQITPLVNVGTLSDKLQAVEGWLKPVVHND